MEPGFGKWWIEPDISRGKGHGPNLMDTKSIERCPEHCPTFWTSVCLKLLVATFLRVEKADRKILSDLGSREYFLCLLRVLY